VALPLGFGGFGAFSFLGFNPYGFFRLTERAFYVILLAVALAESMLSMGNVVLFVNQRRLSRRMVLVIWME
jgi:hypothetical protein